MNAYHLRDWIRCSHRELEAELVGLFSHFEMGFCRDIANGNKHKKLKSPSIEEDFNFYREYDYFETKNNAIKHRIAFWDEKTKEIRKWDIFEFVEIVYSYWRNFVKTHLLIEGQN